MMNIDRFENRLGEYALLMRLHRPIGIYLLLWPTLWALWLAGQGQPPRGVVLVFVLGVVLMRSAGCVINDIADRKFDPHVTRTRDRPLAAGRSAARDPRRLRMAGPSCRRPAARWTPLPVRACPRR